MDRGIAERMTLDEAVAAIADEGGKLGLEIVDTAGYVEDVAANAVKQAQKFVELRSAGEAVLQHNRNISGAARQAQEVASRARAGVEGSRGAVASTLTEIGELVGAVQSTRASLDELGSALSGVAGVASTIAEIARHTNIVALNASVEAAHAGEFGRGFAIIADAVRDLAQQARDAAGKVDRSLKGLSRQAGTLAEEAGRASARAESVAVGTRSIAEVMELVDSATREIDGRVGSISGAASEVETKVAEFIGGVGELDHGVQRSSEILSATSNQLNGLLGVAERILGLLMETGLQTGDSPYAALAQALAADVARAFEAAVAGGQTTLEALFDDRYQLVPGTNPKQHLARFTGLTDAVVPPITEPPLRDPKIAFVAPVDRNGYLPTHNKKFSQPQGRDPVWNAANCRNRRIFDDRVGLAAARNQRPFLLQCYRRDMGGGVFVLMKDVSAPILVQGRHWGALRIGYKV